MVRLGAEQIFIFSRIISFGTTEKQLQPTITLTDLEVATLKGSDWQVNPCDCNASGICFGITKMSVISH